MSDRESRDDVEGGPEYAAADDLAARDETEASLLAQDRGAETDSAGTAAPLKVEPSAGAQGVFCVVCGAEMDRGDTFCHACGWDSRVAPKAPPPRLVDPNPSPYNRLAALLLCVMLGFLGLHRFYVGKVGTGILWLCTLGFLSVGQIFDLVLIATGEFRDAENRRVLRWSDPQVG